MERKVYTGLQAEYVSFGESEINTVTIPDGYSGCYLGTIEIYVTQWGGSSDYGPGYCYDDDENEYIYNWLGYKNRT